jgi:hypothetical protein
MNKGLRPSMNIDEISIRLGITLGFINSFKE